MEEKSLRNALLLISLLTLGFLLSMIYVPSILEVYSNYSIQKAEEKRKEQAKILGITGVDLLEYYSNTQTVEEEEEIQFTGQLRLELPENVSGSQVVVNNDYVNQRIEIVIPTADSDYLYHYPMYGESTHIENLFFSQQKEGGVLEIILDQVYEPIMTYDNEFCYFDFRLPEDIYDTIIVVDAGHGGKDPGATILGYCEKDLTLAILLELRAIVEENKDEQIKVYYTRTTDTTLPLEKRTNLGNQLKADYLISIHHNSTPSGKMNQINGTQIHYNELALEQKNDGSEFAQICLDQVVTQLNCKNRGLTAGSDLFMIRESKGPAVLIEIGFMTNKEELDALIQPEYQKKAALGIYQGILEVVERGKES